MSNNETKHTPGPWLIRPTSEKSPFSKNWKEIAPNVVSAASFDRTSYGETETICGVQISDANAQLIVASPDLLQSLEEFPCDADYPNTEEFREACGKWWKIWAQPALNRATGKDGGDV